MRFMKSLTFFLAMAFAVTSLAVVSTGCEQKKEAKKDEKKKDEAKAPEGGEAAAGEAAAPAEGGEAAPAEGATAEGGEVAPAEGGEVAPAEGGEVAPAEGGEAAAAAEGAGSWGENCNAYFAEVEKACQNPTDIQKPTCDAWLQAVNAQKMAAPADPTASAAAEEGCKQGLETTKAAIAAWQAATP